MSQRTWKPLKPLEAIKIARQLPGWQILDKRRGGGEIQFVSPTGRRFAVSRPQHSNHIPIDLSRLLHADMPKSKKG